MHEFPCVPNSMKFGGNTFYGPRIFQKKFKNFSSSIGWTGAFLVKMVKMYVNFQNHAKPSILIGFSTIKFFLKIQLIFNK
jgi:hypothetical protein